MELNWTTLISSAITAAVNGCVTYLCIRYVGRLVEKVEKKDKK